MQQSNICQNCRSPVKYGQTFCQYCGTLLNNTCPYCRTVISPGVRICPTCGAPAGKVVTPQSGLNPQQGGWYTQQNWSPQQPNRGAPQSGSWQQPGWVAATGRRSSSTTYLLFIILTVVVICLGAFIFWQFGTPAPDKSLPAISGVGISFKGKTSAQIVWQTDTPCSSQVEYGRTAQYGFMEPAVPINDPSTGKSTGMTSHSVTLSNLKAGYTYHYRVKSKNAAGNESISNDFSFKTDSADPFVVPD